MRAFLARLLRSLTSTTLSAQLAGMLIGGILFLHGVATFTVQLVEERQAARSALLEQATAWPSPSSSCTPNPSSTSAPCWSGWNAWTWST